jgi:lysophospholipase L1-like esterase
VIYCGENDLPADTVTAQMLLSRFKEVFSTIREKMPEVPLAYISIKPSPARERYMPLISDCNALIKAYLATQKHTIFIDTYSLMLTPEGKLRPELYIEDQLHMNKKGYAIWIDAIKPHLIR